MILFWPLQSLLAAEAKTGNSIYVSKDEIISGSLYAIGQDINIDGTISGDLIVAAQNITVNGQIEGDIIAVGDNIIINGEVGGNIRVAGQLLTINGTALRNLNAYGRTLILGENSRIGWDAYLAALSAEINGTIDGSLNGNLDQANINGKIGKNLNLKSNNELADSITITPSAIINGDFIYTSNNLAKISNQANIAGKIEQKNKESQTDSSFFWLWEKLFAFISALIVGLIIIYPGKNITQKIVSELGLKPLKSLGFGFASLIITPFILLFLGITIIGLPLALITGTAFFTLAYVAKIFTSLYIGQIILKFLPKYTDPSLFWPLLLGLIISYLLFLIPFLGWLLFLISLCLGLGAFILYVSNQSKNI